MIFLTESDNPCCKQKKETIQT